MVDDASAGFEQEELVEVLEEDSGRLVDRAENGLAGVCQLAKESYDVEGRT
jgi:hypothetical protein